MVRGYFGNCELTQWTILQILRNQKFVVHEMKFVKLEMGLPLLFFVLVDPGRKSAEMLICGPREQSLAEQCFGGKVDSE